MLRHKKYEKRQYTRHPIYRALSVFAKMDNQYLGMISNYSKGGIRLTSAKPIANGETITLFLKKDPDDPVATSTLLKGKVVWINEEDSYIFDIGIQVDDWNSDTQELLSSFCTASESYHMQ